jgi:signal transduction histidine kinase
MQPASVAAPLERQVLDALPITIYTVDLDGRITFLNRWWTRFAQSNGAPQLCDQRAVVGTSLWEAITDATAREQVQQAMESLRAGRAASLSWEFPCSSPTEERIFLMQVSALGSGQAVAGYVFSTVDITPSHRSREVLIDVGMALARTISVDRVLHEVTQQLRRAMACDAVAIALADDDTAALRLVHHSGFVEPAEQLEQRLTPRWLDALARGKVVTDTRRDGIEITAPMTSTEGVIGAVTLSLTALPEAHRLEEARRLLATIAAEAAAAVERAWLVRRVGHKRRLEAIGEVSAGVAHELRNPLFGISSAAQLLRFRVKDDPVVEKNVGRILREVERLNNMVTALLEFGRPNPIALVPGDPDRVWDEVLENQRGLLESRALLLQRTRAAVPVHCAIDPQQLAQVYINLLVNATDAAPEGSDLSLDSSVLPSGAWRCRLHNGGAAIPPEVLPRVFEIFFSTKAGGTGIGLALCQRIVEEHRGTIALESAPDAGTTVTIVLPPSSHVAHASHPAGAVESAR